MNKKLKKLFKLKLFSLTKKYKQKFFNDYYKILTEQHVVNSKLYQNFFKNLKYKNIYTNIRKLPPLHVNMFKSHELISVKKKNISSILTSSGTTASTKSKIYIDQFNSRLQKLVLLKLFSENISQKKIPIIFIENKKTIENNYISAKNAALSGFSLFASKKHFILDDKNEINFPELSRFTKNLNDTFLMFGFTFDVYEYLIKKFKKSKKEFNFENCILLHGGGWKKLENKKIDHKKFNRTLKEKFNFKKIINYYGLIEQAGSIFFSCEDKNYFHVSNFSDINILDRDFNELPFNKKGLVQLKSLIPHSYPGHNILTDDIGVILGEDDCPCGKKGKYFKIIGRLQNSELRGCSNV